MKSLATLYAFPYLYSVTVTWAHRYVYTGRVSCAVHYVQLPLSCFSLWNTMLHLQHTLENKLLKLMKKEKPNRVVPSPHMMSIIANMQWCSLCSIVYICTRTYMYQDILYPHQWIPPFGARSCRSKPFDHTYSVACTRWGQSWVSNFLFYLKPLLVLIHFCAMSLWFYPFSFLTGGTIEVCLQDEHRGPIEWKPWICMWLSGCDGHCRPSCCLHVMCLYHRLFWDASDTNTGNNACLLSYSGTFWFSFKL